MLFSELLLRYYFTSPSRGETKTGSTSDKTLTLQRPQTEDARRIIRSAYQRVTTKLQLPEIDLFDEFDWLRVFRVVSVHL
jgi:hypothetical protein